MRIDRPNLPRVCCRPRTGRRPVEVALCAAAVIVLSAAAMPEELAGLRQPASTQLIPTVRTSGCPCLIGTTDTGGRPVVAGFRQSLTEASPAESAAGVVSVSNGVGQELPYGVNDLGAVPGGRFSPRAGAGWGFRGVGGGTRPRHQGIGRPLPRESWLYRPFGASSFAGVIQGSTLIDDWVDQKAGCFAGYRLGWDFDYYWGCEIRYAFGTVPLSDSRRAKDAAGNGPDYRHDCDVVLADFDLLYYPWGDSTWRPYFMVGLGAAGIRFEDRLGNAFDATVFAMPVGIGLKYRWTDWLILRFDCADNVIFGDGYGFNMLHDLSITGGLEFRFGGSRTAYWPWNSSRHYW